MDIKRFEVNLFGECTYILSDPVSTEAAIIDAGMMNDRECHAIDLYIESNNLKVKYLITTHLHIDHVAGADYIKGKYGVMLSASLEDAFLGERLSEQARMFGLANKMSDKVEIDMPLRPGDTLMLGNEKIEVIAVPGHSPGSIALYVPSDGVVFTGDALFKGSIGRTDLPGGDFSTLIKSIQNRLLVLPDDTIVYPGHGERTTIGYEKHHNPFLSPNRW